MKFIKNNRNNSLASVPECLRDPVFYLISNLPEDFEFLFFRSYYCCKVLKTFMNYFSCSGELGRKLQIRAADWTGHFSPIADSNRQVKYDILKFLRSF